MLAEGECLLIDGRERAVVEHLEKAKDAEVSECAVPTSIRRLGRAGDARCVGRVYGEGGEKGEKAPAKDDKKDNPERSLGELLVGWEGSTWIMIRLCLCVSSPGIAHLLDGII